MARKQKQPIIVSANPLFLKLSEFVDSLDLGFIASEAKPSDFLKSLDLMLKIKLCDENTQLLKMRKEMHDIDIKIKTKQLSLFDNNGDNSDKIITFEIQ
jgi:hypothetical protein